MSDDYETPSWKKNIDAASQTGVDATKEVQEITKRIRENSLPGITPQEYAGIFQQIQNGEITQPEMSTLFSAMAIARRVEQPLDFVIKNHDYYLSQFGIDASNIKPDAFWESSLKSLQRGLLANEQRQLWGKIRQANSRGDSKAEKAYRELVDGLDKELELNRDLFEDNRIFLTRGLNAVIESVPYMAYISGAVVLGSLVAPGVGTVSGFAAGWKLNADMEYGSLIKAGVKHEIADRTSLWVGAVESGIESLVGRGAGAILKNVGGKVVAHEISDMIAGKVIGKLHLTGIPYMVAKFGLTGLLEAFGEGAEEVEQALTGYAGLLRARNIQYADLKKALENPNSPESLTLLEDARYILLEDQIKQMSEEAAFEVKAQLLDLRVDVDDFSDFLKTLPKEFEGGFLSALVLGATDVVLENTVKKAITKNDGDLIKTIKQMKYLSESAKTADSFESYEVMNKGNPVLDDYDDKTRKQILEKTYALYEDQREKLAAEEKKDTAEPYEARPTEEFPAAARRRGGRLAVEFGEGTLDEDDFTETHRMTVRDPVDGRLLYGGLDFRRGENGDIVVEGVQLKKSITDRDVVISDMVKELGYEFPGSRIEWEPGNNVEFQEIRDRLLEENPAGEDLGLNWFRAKGDFQAAEQAAAAQRWISDAAPDMDRTAVSTAAAGLDAFMKNAPGEFSGLEDFARKAGLVFSGDQSRLAASLERDLQNAVTPTERRAARRKIDQLQAGKVKGARFNEFNDYLKRVEKVVYLGQNSDASTVVHELTHAWQDLQGADVLASMGKTMDGMQYKKNGKWAVLKWNGEFTEDFSEALAYGHEEYARTGEAPTPGLKKIFDRLADFIRKILKEVGSRVKLTPEVQALFDRLYTGALAEQVRGEAGAADTGAAAAQTAEQTRFAAEDENAENGPRGHETENDTANAPAGPQRAASTFSGGVLAGDGTANPVESLINRASSMLDELGDRETVVKELRDLEKLYPPETNQYRAPNGKPSLLLESLGEEKGREAWYAVRTSSFKKWFGDWESAAEIAAMESRVQEWLTEENIKKVQGKSREKIFATFGNELRPVAYIDSRYLKYLDISIKDNRVYSGMGYFLEHAVNHHPEINITEYGKIQDILDNPDDVKLDDRFEGRKSVVFIKKYDTFGTVVVGLGETENGKLVFHKTFFKKSKSPYPQLRDIRAIVPSVDGPPTISPADESTAAVNLSALDDTTNIGHFVRSVNPSEVSQVRDANREPLVVYHGTGAEFDIFDQTKDKAGQYGDGFYFTPDKDIARNYGDRVIAAFINARTDSREARRTGMEKDHLHTKDGTDYWIVKNPEQIKSATDNAGTYSNENPSILFQAIGEQGAAMAMADADTENMAQDDLQAEKPYYKANVQKNVEWLLDAAPVAEISEDAIQLDSLEGKNFVDKIYNLFVRDTAAQVTRGGWKINLSKSGIRASRTKGLGALKINAFAALPQIITGGIITDVNRNWKGRGYDSYFINAPVKIGETDYIVEVIVNRGKNGIGNFYLHEVEKKSKLHGVQQAGMDTRTPEGASKLNITRLLEESNTENENSSTLLQLTDDEIRDEAIRYPSPEAWREAAEIDVIFGLDPVSPEGMSETETEAWFTSKWEEAQGIRRDEAGKLLEEAPVLTSNEIDRRLLETWEDEAGLVKWLKALNMARRETPYSGQALDEADGAIREEEDDLRTRINREVHPSILMAAQRVSRGRKLDPKVRRQVMTLLERGIVYYRDLYVEITGDPEFAGYARNEIEVDRYVEQVRGKDLSITQKQRLTKDLRNEELRKEYETGRLTGEKARKYIETLEEEKKEIASKLRKAETALAEDDAQLREDERTYYRQRQEIARDEETLADYEREIVRLEEALAKLKALSREEKSKARDAEITRYEDRIGKLIYKERALREALASARQEARKTTATAKADAALAASMAVGRVKAEAARNERERRAAKRLLEDRRDRVKRAMKKPGPGIWHEDRDRIQALQQAFLTEVNPVNKGKKVTWNGETMPVTVLRQKALNGEIDTGLLDKRLQDRVFRRDLNELFDSDIDALITELDSLEAEGRAVWKEIEARRVHEAASTIARLGEEQNRLAAEGKTKAAKRYIKYLKAKTTAEQKKIADSADSKFTRILWEGWKDANLFRHMDGEAEGVIYELFRKEGNAAKREKYQQMDRRIGEIITVAHQAGMMDKDGNVSAALRKKKILVKGLGPDGIVQEMTIPQLMLSDTALKNEKMRAAMLYGNFLSPKERRAFEKRIKEAGGLDEEERKKAVKDAKRKAKESGGKYQRPVKPNAARDAVWAEINRAGQEKEALLKKAIAENLTEKELAVAQAIVDNFGDNFDRIKDVFFQMFNQDVGSQNFYLPMIRTTDSGGKTKHEEMATALNLGTTQVNVGVYKGMMFDREKISPWMQTPIELDIFKVFFKGVEREEHFAAFAPHIRKLNAIFKQKNHGAEVVQGQLEAMYGKFAMERLRNHINVLGAPDSVRSNMAERMLDGLSGKAAMAEIGFNVASYLAQYPQSSAAFMGHVSLGQYLSAATEYLKDHKLFNETVKGKSAVLRHRVINYAQEYYHKMKESGKFTEAQLKIAGAAMKMQEIADWQAVSIGWWAVYQKEVNANGGNEEAAIAKADTVVLDTQPNMDETELSPIFSKGPFGLPKALTRYGAPLNVVWNQLSYPIYSMVSGGIPNAIKNGTLQRLVGVYTAFGIANALVALMRGKFGDDDDDPDDKIRLLAYYVIASPLAESVPVVSNFVSPAVMGTFTGKGERIFPQKITPMVDLGATAWQRWTKYIYEGADKTRKEREELFKKAMWDTILTGMYGTGLPANQVRKFRTAYEEETFWPVIGFRPEKKK